MKKAGLCLSPRCRRVIRAKNGVHCLTCYERKRKVFAQVARFSRERQAAECFRGILAGLVSKEECDALLPAPRVSGKGRR